MGGDHIKEVQPVLCDMLTCPNLTNGVSGRKVHKEKLGGNHIKFTRNQKYRIPPDLVRYLCGFPDRCIQDAIVYTLKNMRPEDPEMRVATRATEDECLHEIAKCIQEKGHTKHFVRHVITTEDPVQGAEIEALKARIVSDYALSVFDITNQGPPPIRGPHGEATIELKPNAYPVKQRMYQIHGERGEAWGKMIDKLVEEGKLEDGVSAWSSPSFPVPKKNLASTGW